MPCYDIVPTNAVTKCCAVANLEWVDLGDSMCTSLECEGGAGGGEAHALGEDKPGNEGELLPWLSANSSAYCSTSCSGKRLEPEDP